MSKKCPGSGFILGGYRKEYEGLTVRSLCFDCWQMVDEVPIDPEPRTDLRKDGSVVLVMRKQVVDHDYGNAALRWLRRDGPGWLFWIGIVMAIYSLFSIVRSL